MFTFKPRLISEGGFALSVAYRLNYVFLVQMRSFTYKPARLPVGDLRHIYYLSVQSCFIDNKQASEMEIFHFGKSSSY